MRVVHHRLDGTSRTVDGVRILHRVREGLKLWVRGRGVPRIETISGGRVEVLRNDGSIATRYSLGRPPRFPLT